MYYNIKLINLLRKSYKISSYQEDEKKDNCKKLGRNVVYDINAYQKSETNNN